MKKTPYPLKFYPVYKDYPWGGSRIPKTFHRDVPAGIYAESWEISDRDDGMSVVSNGPLSGQTLHELLQTTPEEILGSRVKGHRFPLLVKLIDAKQKLSVQVHPNDQTAAQFGGEAKTEMWYLLGDNPTQVYCGLKKNITRAGFLQAIQEGTSAETLRTVPVEKNSAVFVPGGHVHAIDAGCLILEIQQNSNTTYRLYDWDRMGNDGRPRDLHIEQAIQVIDWNDHQNPLIQPKRLVDTDSFQCWEIIACEYFRLEKLCFSQPLKVPMSGKTFHALFIAEGKTTVEWAGGSESANTGESILIPAALPAYTLSGNATVLRITVP